MACPNLPTDFGADLGRPDPEGSVYLAIRGDGAAEVRGDSAPTTLRRNDLGPTDPIVVCASVERAHSDRGDEGRVLAHITGTTEHPAAEPVRIDSQCKYAVVARGQADVYLRLPTRPGYVERIWDHAAGALIAAESGCAVTDIRGEPLDFAQGRGLERNRGILCAPPRAHGLVLGALHALSIV
jgi:3'(2'), 5'-bisphosphate nucleotidase